MGNGFWVPVAPYPRAIDLKFDTMITSLQYNPTRKKN